MKIYNYDKYNYVRICAIPFNEIDKIDFAHCNEPRETLLNFYKRQNRKPTIISNAGFFNMANGVPVFNYMDEGKKIAVNTCYQWGIGITNEGKLKYGCLSAGGWKDFISGYPNLVDDGKAVDFDYALEIDYKARRTMIGYNDEYVYLVWVENPGLRLTPARDIMVDLGCKYAINLDGGGSTKALYNGKGITQDATNRAVDNVLMVFLKEKNNNNKDNVVCKVCANSSWKTGWKVDSPLQGFQLNGDYKYRAHTMGGKWLPWVNGDSDFAGVVYRCCFKGRFQVTSPRGNRYLNGKLEFHKGLDIVGLDDTTVYSISTGVVRVGYQASGAGNYVVVTMDNGKRLYYMHLKSVLVKDGDKVDANTKLGVMGATGNATGAHTHLELRPAGTSGDSLDISAFTGIPNKVGVYESKLIDAIQIKNAVYRVNGLPWVNGTNDYAGIFGKEIYSLDIKGVNCV